MFGSKSGTRTHTKIEKTKCSGRMIPGPFIGTPRTNRLNTGNNRRPVWSWPRRCPSSTPWTARRPFSAANTGPEPCKPAEANFKVMFCRFLKGLVRTYLVKTGGIQSLSEYVADAGQIRHGFVPHGFGHKVPVLLRCAGHFAGRLCFSFAGRVLLSLKWIVHDYLLNKQ